MTRHQPSRRKRRERAEGPPPRARTEAHRRAPSARSDTIGPGDGGIWRRRGEARGARRGAPHVIGLVLSTTLGLAGGAAAEDNIGKIGATTSGVGVQYERALGQRVSLLGALGLAAIDTTINGIESRARGTGLLLAGRYYLGSGRASMTGAYVGPHYIRIGTEDDAGVETDVTSVGLSVGYQRVFASQLTAEIGLGLGSLDVESDRSDVEFLDALGLFPYVGVALGYRF